MTTLVIGADGQLGSELQHMFSNCDLALLTHTEFELTNPLQIWYTDCAQWEEYQSRGGSYRETTDRS